MPKNLLYYIKQATIFLGMPIVFLIWVYQKTFSPDHGPLKRFFPYGYCRFYPSCSEYGKQSIKKHGLFVGTIKAGWRLLRCNPWNKGGMDLP
ncbi:MAG: membrane protein insertion efficiency factor YidD [Candidatus Magasanikbacteria bacterium]